ncbi:MAG: alpha-glucan family phosphorylase [Acidimicrobiales bacterium]
MRALRSFTVRPDLPEALAPLRELAMNLRWAWDEPTRDLFRWVDPDAWDATHHDPVRVLATASPERLAELSTDPAFLRYQGAVADDLGRYLDEPRWFQTRSEASSLTTVAYFSPEFGIAEALPQYSGGLGILAGDHLKSASDLGVPLVGVGLFYRHGYFRQGLSPDGWQTERFPDQDPWAMPLTRCDGVRVQVELAGTPLVAQVWRADVGRIPLYLLDADVEDNPVELRGVTDRLYGGDVEHRLRQEILLGIGGVRVLEALGIDAQVFHTNEGHAGFLGLERMRRAIVDHGLTFDEAVEATRAASIFTTHTPVPAGIDRFPRPLIETYFGGWAAECGTTVDDLMALGFRESEAADERDEQRFNMAVMGLRLAGRSNACRSCTGRSAARCSASCGPTSRPTRCPSDRSPTASTAARGCRPMSGPARPPRAPGVGRGRARCCSRLWGARRRDLAGEGQARAGWSRSSGRGSSSGRSPRACPHPRLPGPTTCSTPTPSPSGSPAASPPTSGPTCSSPSPNGSRRCSSTPTVPCSSSSPARPTRPTTPARR